MSHYLDPKADVVFKKIFGEHPHLLKSFLNAVLPLSAEHQIQSLEYLPNELVPLIPLFKSSVVDVRCTDSTGQVFIVEMQIDWTAGFMQRMLFNASKAYIKQLVPTEDYRLPKPVYGLALLNSSFDPDPQRWYHHYKMVNTLKPEAEIKDLQLVFIELSKFEAKNLVEKKLQILWLRFMSEINQKTTEAPAELLTVEEIREAICLAEEAAYSPAELDAYDRYWDVVRTERMFKAGYYDKGMTKGLEKGEMIGIKKIALRLMKGGALPLEEISVLTGFSVDALLAFKKTDDEEASHS